jgi:hypothetical protein
MTEGYKKALLESKYKVKSKDVINDQNESEELASYVTRVMKENQKKQETTEKKMESKELSFNVPKREVIKELVITKKIKKINNKDIQLIKHQIKSKQNKTKLSKADKIRLAKKRAQERKLKKLKQQS